MCLRMTLSAGLIMLTAGTAFADGLDLSRISRPVKRTTVLRQPLLIPLVPDCYESWGPRLLACEPRLYLANDSPPALFFLRSPPRRLPKPYPSLFSWQYGEN